MKDSKRRSSCSNNGVSRSCVTRTIYSPHNVTGSKSVKMRSKSSDHDLILRRLQENLRYHELRLLIPPRSTWQQRRQGNAGLATAAKVHDLKPCEIPEENKEEKMIHDDDKQEEDQKDSNNITVVFERPEEPFIPSITIRKMEGSLLIQAVVLKDLASTSVLFCILEEEEGIDIVSENHYRSENKVAYTIQVKVQADYNLDVLEKKLCTWAGKQTRPLHSF